MESNRNNEGSVGSPVGGTDSAGSGMIIGKPAHPGEAPLDNEHLLQLAQARRGQKPLRRAATVATITGIFLLVAACFSFLLGLFDYHNFIVAAILTVLGVVELRAAGNLRSARTGAARILMFNEAAIGLLLLLYAGHGIYTAATADMSTFGLSPSTATFVQQHPESGLQGIGETARLAMFAYYGLVGVFGVLYQGGMAFCYARKEVRLRRWQQETPDWTRDILRRAA